MLKFIKKRWYLIIISLFVLFIVIKGGSPTSKKENEDGYTLKRDNLKEVLSFSGKIEAEEKVALRFQTSGRLAWVGVKEGDKVNKYQVIANLDQRDLSNRLTKYLNTYAKQRNSFEQTKDDNWNDQYALSQNIRDEAKRVLENNQYDLSNAVLDVEYQTLSVEYANLITPIEGIVTHIDTVYPGVNITPAGAEFDIVNPNTLYFSATAEQTDVIRLQENMNGTISLDAYPDKEYQGKLYYISFVPKEGESGTVYELRLSFDKEVAILPLKLGMTGDLSFNLKELKDVLSVPSRYVKKDKKGNYLMVGKNGQQIKKYVKLGEEIDSQYVILNGVEEGEVVHD